MNYSIHTYKMQTHWDQQLRAGERQDALHERDAQRKDESKMTEFWKHVQLPEDRGRRSEDGKGVGFQ